MRDRKGQRESRTGGKRGSQPQLSAPLNVLTAHLNISLCHELFVSPNVCVCLHVKGAGGLERLRSQSLLLIGNPLISCPQGHFLLLAHLPGNPPVTPWPSVSASRQIRGFPWKQQALLSFLPFSLTPAELLLIQTPYPSLPRPEAITLVRTHKQV